MKYLTAVNTVLLACLCVVGLLAMYRQSESQMGAGAAVRQDTCPLTQYALQLVKREKYAMARELLVAATRKTTPQAEYWQSLATACDAFIADAGTSDADTALLRQRLRAGLLSALATAKSAKEVDDLLPLYEKLADVPSDVTPESGGRGEDESWVVDMLREGLRLSDDDPKRSDMLIQIALDQQPMYPGSVQTMWPIIRGHVEQMEADRDRVAALTIYLDSVTDAIRSCHNIELVQRLWTLKTEVETERRKYLEGWRSTLDDELKQFLSEVKSGGLEAITSRHRSSDNSSVAEEPDLYGEIEAFEALATPLGIAPPNTLGQIPDAVSDAVSEAIREIEVDLESQRQAVKTEKLEPARAADDAPISTGEGPCEALLWRAMTAMEDVNSRNVLFWLSRGRTAPEDAVQGGALHAQRLGECIKGIKELQTVAYNLWALRQIHAAGEVTMWSDYLGAIDVGLLHPSVHAMYSQVSDSRLNRAQDSSSRLAAMAILLNKEKIPLKAF